MGIPKYFRWLSERYPLSSQLLTTVPEFDNLYLDMNGIIHNCSHPEGKSLTEPEIFTNIFRYIDFIFAKIQPRKLFFMGIDGVAPRAKMNEQRARRFRAAAERAGDEEFDSNCITPGTEFMARLTEALRYFVTKKITEDKGWRGPMIVLSGHEVPGEGEHKIIDYIRKHRQPNERHCIYGLDADLVMLGLLSHEPHVSLLREEVFRPHSVKIDSSNPNDQRFYLLHLSILRGCIEKEFESLKPFDLERIIDDYIMIDMLVGNDFLPTLPDLQIADGGMLLLMSAYKQIDPPRNGYLHEHGIINFDQFQRFIRILSRFEKAVFMRLKSEGKSFIEDPNRHPRSRAMPGSKSKRKALTPSQKRILARIRKFVFQREENLYIFPPPLGPKDCAFVESIAAELNLKCYPEFDHNGMLTMCIAFAPEDENADEESQTGSSAVCDESLVEGEEEEEEEDTRAGGASAQADKGGESEMEEEARDAIERVLKKYESGWDPEEEDNNLAFYEWKAGYYKAKLHLDYPIPDTNDEFPPPPESIVPLCRDYIKTIQWVLQYYFSGIASWTWFYPHHYAPRITDLCTNLADYKVDKFDLGTPHRPFEQLMSVLPSKSRNLVPSAFRRLMVDVDSPIIDFYPEKFDTDLNGKKMPWEAVVLIDFVNTERLRAAMEPFKKMLRPEEQRRNEFGQTYIYSYDKPKDEPYLSPLPGTLPNIPHPACRADPFTPEDPLVIPRGLLPEARPSCQLLAGFPSLDTMSHTADFEFHKVRVFLQESKNESLVLRLPSTEDRFGRDVIRGDNFGVTKGFAKKILDKRRVFVEWPYLYDSNPVAVWDHTMRHVLSADGSVVSVPLATQEAEQFRKESSNARSFYNKRFAIITAPTVAMIEVQPFESMMLQHTGALVRSYAQKTKLHLLDTTIIEEGPWGEDARFRELPPRSIVEHLPLHESVIFLGGVAEYGRVGTVIASDSRRDTANIRLEAPKFDVTLFAPKKMLQALPQTRYYPSFVVTKMLQYHPLAFSKVMSSLHVNTKDGRANIGLNLKFDSKELKVLEYSRKTSSGWEFSDKAVGLFKSYMAAFPEVLKQIEKKCKNRVFNQEDLFENDKQLLEVKRWLKSQDTKRDRVSLESNSLPADTVARLFDMIKGQESPKLATFKISKVPRRNLLKPSEAQYRLSQQHFSLGDRVTYVLEHGGFIPFGAKGLVVGVYINSETDLPKSVDVVFDEPFISGSDLDGRCPDHHGANLLPWMILNMTHRQVGSGKQPAPAANKAVPSALRSGHAHHPHHGANPSAVPHRHPSSPPPAPERLAPWAKQATAPKPSTDILSRLMSSKGGVAGATPQGAPDAVANDPQQPHVHQVLEEKFKRLGLSVLPTPAGSDAAPQNSSQLAMSEKERVQKFLDSINKRTETGAATSSSGTPVAAVAQLRLVLLTAGGVDMDMAVEAAGAGVATVEAGIK
ncbi:exonuclease II Exo2, partial [Spiromyces aspiralis]